MKLLQSLLFLTFLTFAWTQTTIVELKKALLEASESHFYVYRDMKISRMPWNYGKDVRTIAAGCILDYGVVLHFGDIHRTGYFLLRCDRVNDTAVALTPIACMLDGEEMAVGKSRRQNFVLYSCLERNGRIGLEVTGCVGDGNEISRIGQTFRRNGFFYTCSTVGTSVVMKPVACMIAGERVNVGIIVHVERFWYKCAKLGESGAEIVAMGCLDRQGKRVNAGRKFRDGGFLYKCKVIDTGLTIVFAGCIAEENGQVREYCFGEHWYTRPRNFISHKILCTGNEKNVRTEPIECYAHLDFGIMPLTVGQCAHLGGGRIFLCAKEPTGALGQILTVQAYANIQKTLSLDNIPCDL